MCLLVLDYSERGDLFAVWTRVRRFDERSVQQYVAEMAVALGNRLKNERLSSRAYCIRIFQIFCIDPVSYIGISR